MGSDKALLQFGGMTLLERALQAGHAIAEKLYIVGQRGRYGQFGEVIEDIYPDCGPLGGIHAALSTTTTDLNLMLSVDMPLMAARFLEWLVRQAQTSRELIVVPDALGGLQPLCAIYRPQARDAAEQALKRGDYKISHLFSAVHTRQILLQEIVAAGFSPDIFRNVNTSEEYEELVRQKRLVAEPQPMEDEKKSPMPEQKPYIEFQNVYKAFGSNVVLDGVSFDVMPGETVCILGRSGVGKSVSLHNIMGFLKPDSGRIWVAYEDITDYPESEMERIRKKVTMVFQNGALFDSLTVGENVAFPLRERGGLAEEQIYQIIDGLLDMVGVREFRDLLPSDLSTGMKRSVAIARALAAQPDAVLYDEPTTMVDPLMAHLLGDLIQKLKKQLKLTSIVVTHDMALAKKLADRLLFLHEAKAIFFGTFPEMAKCQEPIVQEFLELDSMDFEHYFGAQRPPHQPRFEAS
jgi:ABC-type transporter Mla maintaining outer membrane lipid asymmetry ATPase subunit MlaF/molybdopterin-guanine dinucleotide biosynthesis protein A